MVSKKKQTNKTPQPTKNPTKQAICKKRKLFSSPCLTSLLNSSDCPAIGTYFVLNQQLISQISCISFVFSPYLWTWIDNHDWYQVVSYTQQSCTDEHFIFSISPPSHFFCLLLFVPLEYILPFFTGFYCGFGLLEFSASNRMAVSVSGGWKGSEAVPNKCSFSFFAPS